MKPLFAVTLAALFVGSVPVPVCASEELAITHGARLYDDWALESNRYGARAGHPPTNAKSRAGSAAVLPSCRECHGIDYRGVQGIVGVLDVKGRAPKAIVEILTNNTHQYGTVLGEDDLLALALFLSNGQLDTKALANAAKQSKTTSLPMFESLFGNMCGGCHGQDGRRMRAIPPVGDLARQRPDAVLHAILYGHPGREMPALMAFGTDNAIAMLGYLQTLPSVNQSVSIARGGRLYDDWQMEEGAHQQGLPHPSYLASAQGPKAASVTWRCRTCHGWDYKGVQDDKNAGSAPGATGIRKMVGADPAQIVGILRNKTHQYGAVLNEPDLMDLANFVSQGQVDMDTVIDKKTRLFHGNAARGKPIYQTVCAGCHGENGKGVTSSLGRSVKRSPYGSLHLILNGHPGEAMPALRDMNLDVSTDILTYVQGLK